MSSVRLASIAALIGIVCLMGSAVGTRSVRASDATPAGTPHRIILYITGIASDGNCSTPERTVNLQNDSPSTPGWKWLTSPLSEAFAIPSSDFLEYIYEDGFDSATACSDTADESYDRFGSCWSLDDSSALGNVDGQATKLHDYLRLLPPEDEVAIIAHSQGGVLAAYVASHWQDDAVKKIKSIVTLDSPLSGIGDVPGVGGVLDFFAGCNGLDERYDSAFDMQPSKPPIQSITDFLAAPEVDYITRLFTVDETGNDFPGFEKVNAEGSSVEWEAGHLSVHTGDHDSILNGTGDAQQTTRLVNWIKCAVLGPSAVPRGDVNCDGRVDTGDVLCSLKKQIGLPYGECIGGDDINCDGGADAEDSLSLLKAFAGLYLMPDCNQPHPQPPIAPGNIDAFPIDQNTIRVSWSDNSNNEGGFEIFDGVDLSYVDANITNWSDTTVSPGETKCYHLRSYNADGYSDRIGPACATTPESPGNHPPNPPSPYFPPDGSTIYFPNQPDLCWESNGDPDGDPLEYKVVVGLYGDPYSLHLQSGWFSNTCLIDLSDLATILEARGMDSGTFGWHVVARDPSAATSDASECWNSGVAPGYDCYENPFWSYFTLYLVLPQQGQPPTVWMGYQIPVLAGEITHIFSVPVDGTADSLSWSAPGASPSSGSGENFDVTFPAQGEYDVTLTACNQWGCSDDTHHIFVDGSCGLYSRAGDAHVLLTIGLHGIGAAGDNASPDPSASNKNPLHPVRNVSVEVYDITETTVLETVNGTLTYDSNSGYFKGSLNLGNLTSCVYPTKVLVPGYLKRFMPLELAAGVDNVGPTKFLVTGDVNRDNALTVEDYNTIVGCINPGGQYGSLCALNPDNPTRSDLTDNGVLDIYDSNLFIRECTEVGLCAPVTPLVAGGGRRGMSTAPGD